MGIFKKIKTRMQMNAEQQAKKAAMLRFRKICILPEDESLENLESSLHGITTGEAGFRLEEYGPNLFAIKEKYSFIKDIFGRLKNPLVIQLMLICAVSFYMNDYRSSAVVGCMIFLSVFLSYFQERKSSRASEKLQKMIQATAIVVREKNEMQIAIEDIVPGDIVVLTAGSIIPADVRILFAKDFFVSQSAFTGESMPVEKYPNVTSPESRDILEFENACFQGSNVISGSARALVVNTGVYTVLGSISQELSSAKGATSFDEGVSSFVWLMVRFMILMVSTTFLIVGLSRHNWGEALLFGVSVAVGLTPEMLPMIITVCLSKGAITMSKKKVIVKKLKAIQNLGAMNILCTDKTGTLTQDNIILERHVDVAGRKSEDVLEYAYMNSFYQTGLRSLLDKAILAHNELDVERDCRKVDEIPFDFIRKRMSVIIDHDDRHMLICKGAVEDVYSICDRYQIDDDIYPLIDMVKSDLLEDYYDLSAQGYRILAIAYNEYGKDKEVFSSADENNLILLGYVAFFDPPKDSAARALIALKKSGVDVKILTGDNELVTKKICHDVHLEMTKVFTGRQLADMDDETFRTAICEGNVFAKLTPSQKEKIIRTLRDMGNVVGFLGDGINDAPAMKAADVGISVDTAVDIAKESADIILLERSLMVLEDGIIEGRKTFANIIKYIKMGASSNFGNMFSVVGGSYFLPFLPMAPIQVLINNLLYDFSQVGIPSDNVDDEFIEKPHKWDIGFIKKFMIFIGPMSSIFDYATFFLMLYFFNCIMFSNPGSTAADKAHYEALFHTGWFVESLLTQTLIVHIIRTNKIPFFQSRASFMMSAATISVMLCAVALPYSPVAGFVGLVPLPWTFWLWIAGFLAAYGFLTHHVKTWFYRRFGGDS